MKENWLEIFVFGVMLVATVVIFTLIYTIVGDCRDEGGIVVKGLFGLECITR